ncbi:GntR family transcriptional regulator [Mycobacterium sp. KBS0706]|uniref:GntR family transcriptional regulator n=1 Tax=Mycobacterium sp. KBS0706 TaxID=2578109 RepID=UPI00110F972C|nr:GntR family transcriptional regulator [Mycobacterium sp. KBS0706]TSD88817.1 GntR family transcriptional regulator [Mycobacterium sp. KBS0706]
MAGRRRADQPRTLPGNIPLGGEGPIGRQVYEGLRQAIITGLLPPGTALSEKDGSEMFGVSRQPVREAFIKLVEAGLLQVLPQRGTRVRKISRRQVEQGRFIREAVEAAVVRLAAESIDAAGLLRLDRSLEAQHDAARRQDHAGFLALDEGFHRLIIEAIDCLPAWSTIENMKAQMDRVRYLSLPDVSPLEMLIAQHEEIVAGLRAHDPDAAEAAMRRHLREILSSLGPIAERRPELFELDA